MEKKTLFTLLSIFYMLATTLGIYLGFFILEPSRMHLIAISILSFIGYSAAYEYHLLAQEKQGEYTLHTIGFVALIVIVTAV